MTPHTPPTQPTSELAHLAAREPGTVRRLWPLAALLIVAALLYLVRHRITFDVRGFFEQLHHVSFALVLLALVTIYIGYTLRATRWAILLRPVCRATTAQLIPSQFIGFTAVALFGRVADLARPYLVARRLRTSVASQLAIYSIERAFDLAAAAILFSITLALAPRSLPHHEAFTRAGLLSLAATALLAGVACTLRFAGNAFATLARRLLHPLSAKAAATVHARLLEFQLGFRTVTSWGQFLGALAVSLLMWLTIALTYLLSARAFRLSPVLAHMSFTAIMLLLATSLGASLLQLPVLGWFTQIAATAASYRAFYAVPVETASACATLTLLTTSLSIIPAGLVLARAGGIDLRTSGKAGESA